MENANSPEYLEKIKAAVMENLRHTAPVPSVQMQDIPPSFGAMTDEEEAELDDLNEDMNKDVRMTQHDADKRIAHGAEFEESDDEDGPQPNGAGRANSKRQFTDFKNDDAAAESGTATPANQSTTAVEATETEDPDITIEDAGASAAAAESKSARAGSPGQKTKSEDEAAATSQDGDKAAEKEKDKESEGEKEKDKGAEVQADAAEKEDKAAEKEAEKAVDADGDVGMEDAVVKKEDDKQ